MYAQVLAAAAAGEAKVTFKDFVMCSVILVLLDCGRTGSASFHSSTARIWMNDFDLSNFAPSCILGDPCCLGLWFCWLSRLCKSVRMGKGVDSPNQCQQNVAANHTTQDTTMSDFNFFWPSRKYNFRFETPRRHSLPALLPAVPVPGTTDPPCARGSTLLLNLAIDPCPTSLFGLRTRGALYSGGVARSPASALPPDFVICRRHFQFPYPSSKNLFSLPLLLLPLRTCCGVGDAESTIRGFVCQLCGWD